MNAIKRWASRAAPLLALWLLSSLVLLGSAQAKDGDDYVVTNLVTDGGPGSLPASHTDGMLVNPWGIAFNPNGFVWVADNATGVSTLYDGDGVKNSLTVAIPNGKPTGITFNGSTGDFLLTTAANSAAAFIFVTENGIIAGWNPNVNATNAVTKVDNSGAGAIYKGVALGANGTVRRLYAANFHSGRIEVYDNGFVAVTTLGPNAFKDPHVPHGWGPFNIQNIGGDLYVAWAKQDDEAEDEVAGHGLGFVDVFDADGNLLRRLIEHGPLNAPWGMALAPLSFGKFGGMLLVGNFGDGMINAFDPSTGAHRGRLEMKKRPIVIDGLWGIAFGNGIKDQPTNTLFFAAGTNDEANGVYGRIDVDTH